VTGYQINLNANVLNKLNVYRTPNAGYVSLSLSHSLYDRLRHATSAKTKNGNIFMAGQSHR